MPSPVLFTNPVVAQQSMAADQFMLQQRAQELADRNALLENIRLSQDSARQSGDRRYQTDAYRSTAQGQNDIGMVNARTAQDQGDRRLSLDQTIAENEKSYRADQLATQKAIAEINANAAKLRPQDVVAIGKAVEQHNSQADEFNGTAANASLLIKTLADEYKKTDSEAIKKGESAWTDWGGAKSKAKDLKDVPYSVYIGKALKEHPELLSYVDVSGEKVTPRSIKKQAFDNSGRIIDIDPAPSPRADVPQPPTPSQSAANPAAFIPLVRGAGQYPAASGFYNAAPQAFVQPETGASGGMTNAVPRINGGMGSAAVLTNKATGKRFTVMPVQ